MENLATVPIGNKLVVSQKSKGALNGLTECKSQILLLDKIEENAAGTTDAMRQESRCANEHANGVSTCQRVLIPVKLTKNK